MSRFVLSVTCLFWMRERVLLLSLRSESRVELT
jgi:hypothetical protein